MLIRGRMRPKIHYTRLTCSTMCVCVCAPFSHLGQSLHRRYFRCRAQNDSVRFFVFLSTMSRVRRCVQRRWTCTIFSSICNALLRSIDATRLSIFIQVIRVCVCVHTQPPTIFRVWFVCAFLIWHQRSICAWHKRATNAPTKLNESLDISWLFKTSVVVDVDNETTNQCDETYI